MRAIFVQRLAVQRCNPNMCPTLHQQVLPVQDYRTIDQSFRLERMENQHNLAHQWVSYLQNMHNTSNQFGMIGLCATI